MGGGGGRAGTTDNPITVAFVMFSSSFVKTYDITQYKNQRFKVYLAYKEYNHTNLSFKYQVNDLLSNYVCTFHFHQCFLIFSHFIVVI